MDLCIAHVQMKTANSRRLIGQLRKSGFSIYLVNSATCEREPVNDGATIIKASAAITSQKGYFLDCIYNGAHFPSQDIIQAISNHRGVTYFSLNRGNIIST